MARGEFPGIPTDSKAPEVIRPKPDEPLRPGQVVAGRYEVRARLGSGGMGSVWHAHDRTLDEHVALKVILPHRFGDPHALERFRAEVKIARRITHPNVCRVFDLGEDGDLCFLTMELVEGSNLRQQLATGPIAPSLALKLFQQVVAGVAAVHALGIVHRDLKPENVLVRRDGRAVVADFGVARDPRLAPETSTRAGGTPAYMSPEQLLGKPLDVRSDVFALGIMGYELLSGQMPFGGSPAEASSESILKDTPRPLEVPGLPEPARLALQALLERALAKSAEERFASAAELGEALAQVSGAKARPRWALPAAAGLAVLAVLGLLWGWPRVTVQVGPREVAAEERLALKVLPFENLTQDAAWDGLARSATEALRTGLRTMPEVQLEGASPPNLVVRGSVQRIGHKLRLHAHFESPKSAEGSFNCEPVEVDSAPEEGVDRALAALRQGVVDEVRLAARHHARRRRAHVGTASEVAQAKLMQFYTMTGPAPQSQHLEVGLRLLDEAIGADPRYVPALVEHAYLRVLGAGGGSLKERMDLALFDVEQAQKARPGDPEVAVARCRLLQIKAELVVVPHRDAAIDGAMRACQEALLVAPVSAHVHIALARLNDRRCQDHEAMRELGRAVELDRTLSGRALRQMARLALETGQMSVADEKSDLLVRFRDEERRLGPRAVSRRAGAPEVRGIYMLRGVVLWKLGRLDEAEAAFKREIEDLATLKSDPQTEAAAIRGLQRMAAGRNEPLLHELNQRLAEIEADYQARGAAYNLAMTYVQVDPSAAVRWLELASAPRTCDEVFWWVRIYLAADLDARAQQALQGCSPTENWEKACMAQLTARLAGKSGGPR